MQVHIEEVGLPVGSMDDMAFPDLLASVCGFGIEVGLPLLWGLSALLFQYVES